MDVRAQGISAGDFGPLPDGKSPLYARIHDVIARHIREKSPPQGSRLPSEAQLAEHFGVSIVTMRTALQLLEEDGLVDRQQGTGTFVGRSQKRPSAWSISTLEDLAQFSQATGVEVLETGMGKAPAWAAAELGVRAGTPLYHIHIVRSRNGRRFQHTEAFFPEDVGVQLARQDMRTRIMRTHLIVATVEEVIGEQVQVTRQRITAASATRTIADILDLPIRTPILQVLRISETASGRVLQVGRSEYQTQEVAYTFDLYRR